MRTAFVGAFVSVIALVVVLLLVPRRPGVGHPDLLRTRPTRVINSGRPTQSGEAIDLSQTHGEHIYKPERSRVIIDGEPTTYPSLLMWCGEVNPLSDDRFEFIDLRILLNRKPKTQADLDGVARLPDDVHPTAAGDHILRLIKEGRNGIHAGRAVFHGGRDLATADKIQLSDGVLANAFLERGTTSHPVAVETPDLLLDVEAGKIMQADTDAEVTVTHKQIKVRARGMHLDVITSTLVLDHDIRGDLLDLALLGRKGPPAKLSGKGPLRYTPLATVADGQRVKPGAGQIELSGDVTLSQGDLSLRGDHLDLVVTEDAQRRAQHLVLDGNVVATSGRGRFEGEVVTYEAARPEHGRPAHLFLEGSPTKATLFKASGILPGVAAGNDLLLSTPGRVVFPVNLNADSRRIDIGPDVTLTAPESEVHGWNLTIFLHRVADNRADRQDQKTDYPSRVDLRGAVRGRSPSGAFSGETLTYTRKFDPRGRPLNDRLVLRGSPDITYVVKEKASKEAAKPKAEGRKNRGFLDVDGAGRVVISAQDRIEITRDPLRLKPLVALAQGKVLLRKTAPDTASTVRASLRADALELVLDEVWQTDLVTQNERSETFMVRREVRKVDARGHVVAKFPGRFEGRGGSALYAGAQGDLLLKGEGERPAHIEFTDGKDRKQIVTAPKLHYLGSLDQVTASGGVVADVYLPEIHYMVTERKQGASRKTHVESNRLIASLAERASGKGLRLRDLLAETGVEARQDNGSSASCTFLRFDLVHDDLEARGEPTKLVMFRNVDGQTIREEMVSPSITVSAKQALFAGPLTARFFSSRGQLPMNMGTRTWNSSDKKTLHPVDIKTQGDAFLSQERMLLRGPAHIQQGNPYQTGFSLDAGRVLLFLAPTDNKNLAVARAVAERNVNFVSRDLTGKGDVMSFDEKKRKVSLVGKSRPANLALHGIGQMPQPAFDLDLSNPHSPRLVVVQPSRYNTR